MSDTVFILGAGASKDSGVPVMKDFIDRARILYRSNKVKDAVGDFKNVFDAIGRLQILHSKSNFNIQNLEEVFSAFEMASVLGKFEDYSIQKIRQLIQSFKKVILITIENELKFPVKKDGVNPTNVYQQFSALLDFLMNKAQPKHSISIITFNYDIAVDFALHKHNQLRYTYGLDKENIRNNTIPLLKIHGSINWGTCQKCKKIIPYELRNYLQIHEEPLITNRNEEKFVNIPIGSSLHEFEHCVGNTLYPDPIMIPPTWDKFYNRNALSQIWKHAAIELSEAENIFVIGYSYPETDAFFKYLYYLGSVGQNIIRNFWVFNPDDELENHFKNLLGTATINSFKYISEGFGYASGEILKLFS